MDYISKADFAVKGFNAGMHAKWSVTTAAATFADATKTNGVAKGVASTATAYAG